MSGQCVKNITSLYHLTLLGININEKDCCAKAVLKALHQHNTANDTLKAPLRDAQREWQAKGG